MTKRRRRKCLNCGSLVPPEPAQRAASALLPGGGMPAGEQGGESGARGLSKPQNRDYFRGPESVARMRVWRAAHPGYASRRRNA